MARSVMDIRIYHSCSCAFKEEAPRRLHIFDGRMETLIREAKILHNYRRVKANLTRRTIVAACHFWVIGEDLGLLVKFLHSIFLT